MFFFGFAVKTDAQTCEINSGTCPDPIVVCSEVLQQGIGAVVNWTPPNYYLNCGGGSGSFDFMMTFQLNESLSGKDCWLYNKVQRTGNDGGILQLNQSTGTMPPYFASPSFLISSPIRYSMRIYAEEVFEMRVYLMNSLGVKSDGFTSVSISPESPFAEVIIGGDDAMLYTPAPTFGGVTAPGIYRLYFEFVNMDLINKNYIDDLMIDAPIFGGACVGDIDFYTNITISPTISAVANPSGTFFPVGGPYTVTHSAHCNVCTVTDRSCSFTVTVNPTSVGGTATAAASPVCSGSGTTITLTGYTGIIQWQQSADGSTGWANVTGGSGGTTATYTTPNLTSTTYYRAVVTSGVCAPVNSTNALVTVNPTSVGGTASANQTICNGTSPASLTLTGNTGNVVRWEKSSDAVFTTPAVIAVTETTLPGATIGNLTVTTYFRAVVQSGSICPVAYSSTVTINVPAALTASTSAIDIRCSGGKPGEVDLTVNGGTPDYSYSWSGPGGYTNSNQDINNLSVAGTYSVMVTDANGCTKNASAVVNWHDNPTVTIGGPTIPPICGGLESNYLTAEATGEDVTYSWSVVGTGWSIDGSNTGMTISYIAGTSNATFTVVVVDKYGCTATASRLMAPCQGEYHCTYTQGWYGNTGGKNCGWDGTAYVSMSAKEMMLLALPTNTDPLLDSKEIFGVTGKSFTLYGQDIFKNYIFNMLPAGGKSVAFTGEATYSTRGTWKYVPLSTAKKTEGKILNNLLGQTITLFFNMKNDATLGGLVLKDNYLVTADATNCGSKLASPYTSWYTFIPESVLNYFKSAGLSGTVQDLYVLANKALGGITKDGTIALPSLFDIGSAVDAINNGFDECRILVGFFPELEEASAYLTLTQYTPSSKGDEEFLEGDTKVLSEFIEPTLNVYPNPFSTTVNFELEMTFDSNVKLEIYSHNGSLLKVLLDEDMKQGDIRTIEFDATRYPHTSFLYKLTTGLTVKSGTIIRAKN